MDPRPIKLHECRGCGSLVPPWRADCLSCALAFWRVYGVWGWEE